MKKLEKIKTIKILAIGDIFGSEGRKVIKNQLFLFKQKYQIDLIVANVENATHGKGISFKHYQELESHGIDIMTSGNHVFDLEETRENIDKFSRLIRPINSNPYHKGRGSILVKCKNKRIRITNIIGRTFMSPAENPYFAFEKILEKNDFDIHLVDFHAEATAEKIAFALHYDYKKISAFWGTHTHVQTSDERKLPNGTAFITDLGMTGLCDGVIGAETKAIIKRSKYSFNSKIVPYEDKKGKSQFNGVVFEFAESNNKIIKIDRIREIFYFCNFSEKE